MKTGGSKPSDEADIRRRIADWAKALRARDLEGIMSHYAPDLLTFDLAPPLRQRRDAVRKGLAEWLPTWDGPLGYEIRDLAVAAGDTVAFSHSVNRLSGRRTSGETTDVWVRATLCFRKIAGAWMVVHEHSSVPFYMDGSYRAAVDLQP
jgi:uncharacterized protein (TIGR02246 family)